MHKTAFPFEFSLKPVPLPDQVRGAVRDCMRLFEPGRFTFGKEDNVNNNEGSK